MEPMVTIALALYKPNMIWLAELLDSINCQTYQSIEVIICDDCTPGFDVDYILREVKKHITEYPVKVMQNEINQGSNKTFERLTLEAKGEYIAYCDQDDIWEKNKITKLMSACQAKGALLAYSDVSVIDKNGIFVSDSITKIRKRFEYYEGSGLWSRILVRNFISGCCMLVKSGIARAAIPFETGMHHDRWIAIYASTQGYITFVNEPLVRYRQHGENQTGILKGVTDKKTYIEIRLEQHLELLKSLRSRFDDTSGISSSLDRYIEQVDIRKQYAKGKINVLPKILRFLKENRLTILFELICINLPNFIFKKAILFVQQINTKNYRIKKLRV